MVSVCSLQISCRIVYVSEALLFVVAGIQEKIRAKLLHLILGSFDVNSLFEAVFADSFLTYKTLRVCYHHTTQYLNFLLLSTIAPPPPNKLTHTHTVMAVVLSVQTAAVDSCLARWLIDWLCSCRRRWRSTCVCPASSASHGWTFTTSASENEML